MPGPWEKYAAAAAPEPVAEGPWAKYAGAQAPAAGAQAPDAGSPQTSGADASIEGFGQGATLGYLPQLQAAAAKPIYAALNAATGQDTQPDSYVEERDANIARQAKEAKEHPYLYHGSELAGGAATGIATSGAMPAPAATTLGRIAQGARVGAVMGAAANPGDTAGVVDDTGQIPERIMNAGKGMTLGALLSTAIESPQIAKDVANSVKNKISGGLGANIDFTPAPNAGEVKAAADQLGIAPGDVPKALLTDNPTYQKLESGLSQSGSIPAKPIRDQYTRFFKGVGDASEKIADLKTTDSEFGIGSKIGDDLANQVKASTAPVSELYDDLNPLLRQIPVDPASVNSQFGALKRNPIFQTKDGIAMLEDQKSAIQSMPELASLKEYRSTLHDSLGNNSTPLDENRINTIYDAATKIRDNSINAQKNSLPSALHGEVDDVISKQALADSAHASNLDDINSIKALVGNKEFSSPRAFLKKLGSMNEADIAAKASNLDVDTLTNLQDKFPTVFDKVKTAKINDMVQSSTNPVSGFNDTRFLKQWDGMDQEAKDLFFDPQLQSQIDAFQTVKQAIPPKLGPSGTPEGKMMMQMLSPKRTALDLGIKKTLDAASNTAPSTAAAAGAPVSSPIGNGARLVAISGGLGTPAAQPAVVPAANMNKAADSTEPTKGPDKWVNDGLKKLQAHDPDAINRIPAASLSDPKVRDLLIRASDLSPGTKAMDDIMERIEQSGASSSKP